MSHLDGEKDGSDLKCWTPFLFEDVQADGSVCVDVRMVNFGREGHFRWLEWIVRGEVDVKEEHTT